MKLVLWQEMIYMFMQKNRRWCKLTPDLVTKINYEAMELNPFPKYAWITNGVSNVYLNVEDMKNVSEIPKTVNTEKMVFKKRIYKKRYMV